MKDSQGWDGKLRITDRDSEGDNDNDNEDNSEPEPRAQITNPQALEDPEYEDPEAMDGGVIEADEGMSGVLLGVPAWFSCLGWVLRLADLLEDEDPETEVCSVLAASYSQQLERKN